MDNNNLDLNLPPSIGTRKCYECQAEPQFDTRFWEVFKIIDDKEVSVPLCDICLNEYLYKPNYICPKCGYAECFMFVEGYTSDEVIKKTAVCKDCNSSMEPINKH